MNLTTFMKQDHHEGDSLLAKAEDQVAVGRWPQARSAQQGFAAALELHFRVEEDKLFPALEQVMGAGFGPTNVMRQEHLRLRLLLAQLQEALEQEDDSAWFAQADALRILLQQHNLKEESMLYPFADRALGAGALDLVEQLRSQSAEA